MSMQTKVEHSLLLLSVLSLSATFTMFLRQSKRPRASSLDMSAQVEPADLSLEKVGRLTTAAPELGQRSSLSHVEYSHLTPALEMSQKSLLPKLSLSNSSYTYSTEHWKRIQRLHEGCNALHSVDLSIKQLKETPPGTVSLYVNDAQRYIYCRIPKVASTSWVRVLLIASGKVQYAKNANGITQDEAYYYFRHKGVVRPLASYTLDEIEYRLKNYFKFLFVRHPLDRLISSYKDRLQLDHNMPKKILASDIRKYRRSTDHIERGERGVQFAEFVRYVSSPTTRSHNQHWRPQYTMCHPCVVKYDFIGHYETLTDDAKIVLGKIGAPPGVRFPSSDRDNHRIANRTGRMDRMFSDVDISSADVDRLRTAVYAKDFAVFGYD